LNRGAAEGARFDPAAMLQGVAHADGGAANSSLLDYDRLRAGPSHTRHVGPL